MRELARNGDAVFQQIAQTGRGLGALRQHPPAPVGAARQIECGDVQPGLPQRFYPLHGAQVVGVAQRQRRRQQATAQQFACAVKVGHDEVEQARALQHPGFDLAPVLWAHQQRKQVECPRPLRVVLVGMDVVAHAVVAQLLRQAVLAPVQVGKALAAHVFEKLRPERIQAIRAGLQAAQLVEVASGHRLRQGRRHGAGWGVGGLGGRVSIEGVGHGVEQAVRQVPAAGLGT